MPIEAQAEVLGSAPKEERREGEGEAESHPPFPPGTEVTGYGIEGKSGQNGCHERNEVDGAEEAERAGEATRQPEERGLTVRIVVPAGPEGGTELWNIDRLERPDVAVVGGLDGSQEGPGVATVGERVPPRGAVRAVKGVGKGESDGQSERRGPARLAAHGAPLAEPIPSPPSIAAGY